jgi:hypothetical protein
MAFAVEEFDDDRAVARLAWLAHDDQAALDWPAMSASVIPTSTWASAAGRSGCWLGCCTPTSPPEVAASDS